MDTTLTSMINTMNAQPWNLSVISINVNGISTKMWSKLRSLHKQKYDIILMQETKLYAREKREKLQYIWKQISHGRSFISPAAANNSGCVAILLSDNACNTLKHIQWTAPHTNTHRYTAVTASLAGRRTTFHSVYAPVERQGRAEFFNNLPIPSQPSDHLVGGDFNCVLDPTTDCRTPTTHVTTGSNALLAWSAVLEVTDIWRTQHPDDTTTTSPTNNARIDILLLSDRLPQNAQTDIRPCTAGSDHRCPTTTIGSTTQTMAKGHWQLPLWMIENVSSLVNHILNEYLANHADQQRAKHFNKLMRQITTCYRAAHRAEIHRAKYELDTAKWLWHRAHSSAVLDPSSHNLESAVQARELWKRSRIRAIEKAKAQASDQHFRESERCSASFLSRSKAQRRSAPITSVRKPDGATSTAPADIEAHHRSFWARLISRTGAGTETPPITDSMNTLLNITQPILTPTQIERLETPLSEQEIQEAITSLPQKKAAGPDGLRAELFMLQPGKWAKILQQVFETAVHQQQHLPKMFSESVVVLLYKKGDPKDPANYRPIALLNIVAKILTRAHNNRLRSFLHNIVPPTQTGIVPGRSITENILYVQDTIHWAKLNHPSAILLCLDFEKAYDRVDWTYLNAYLTKAGFGPRWRNLIQTIYKNRTARLTINGRLAEPI